MDIENLIGSMVRGALTGRSKRHRGALGYLTGGRRGSGWINGSTLLAAAGLAWGVFETMQKQKEPVTAPATVPPSPPVPVSPAPSAVADAPRAAAAVPPAVPGGAVVADAPPDVLRVIRLTISAACADGTLTAHEERSILDQARTAGIEDLVRRELATPLPLVAISAGVTEPKLKQDLYALAFTIVRADETVTASERTYLSQLSGALGLDPEVAAQLERDAVAGIERADA